MIESAIKLSNVTEINDFVRLTNMCTGDVTIYSGRYIIDGKSLMGIYSLDLSNSIRVEFDGDIPDTVKEEMKKYIAE